MGIRNVWLSAALGAIIATACGGGAAPAARDGTAQGGTTVQIDMSNFTFAPQTIKLKAGQRVTLRFVNRSPLEHEFMAGRMPDAMGGYAEDFFKGVDVDTRSGTAERSGMGGAFELKVAPHMGTGEISFVVPGTKGSYEIGCFVPGHYEAGMKGTLVVE